MSKQITADNKNELKVSKIPAIAQAWYHFLNGNPLNPSQLAKLAKPVQISINTNNRCNLECFHCCYNDKQQSSNENDLSETEWESIIKDSISKLGVRQIHFCGKEPLVDKKAINLMHYIRELDSSIRIGLITNGTLIKKRYDDLSNINLDYLDISLNGAKQSDEILRGDNAFEKSLEGIELAINLNTIGELWVSAVIHNKSHGYLRTHIKSLANFGIRNFFFQPLQALGRGQKLKNLVPKPTDIFKVIKEIRETLMELQDVRCEILIYPTVLYPLIQYDDQIEEIFDSFLKNGTRTMTIGTCSLDFRFYTCVAFWRMFQITSDGWLIGCDFPLSLKNPESWATGNIRESSIETLYKKSFTKNSLFESLTHAQNNCADKDCQTLCHSGCPMWLLSSKHKDPQCSEAFKKKLIKTPDLVKGGS